MTPEFPRIYHDGESLYLEFAKHVQRFPFTEGGLHKALRLIPSIRSAPGYLSGASNFPKAKALNGHVAKIAKGTKHKREVAKFTDEQRSGAMALIRKLGLGDE